MSSDVEKQRPRVGFATAALLIAIAAPALGLAVAVWLAPDSVSSVAPKTGPITVPVQIVTDSEAASVTGNLQWSGGINLLAPAWGTSGTGSGGAAPLVTAVVVKPGSLVSTGSPIADINGVHCVAVFTASPFYRSIGPGVSGADVAMLRKALTSLGYANVGRGATYDAALSSAINALSQKMTGVPPVAGTQGVFDPGWFVWLPVAKVRVASVSLSVGATAPAAGSTVLTSASQISSLALSAASSNGSPPIPLPPSSSGYEVMFSGADPYPLGSSFTITDQTYLSTLSAATASSTTSLQGTIELVDAAQRSSVPSGSVVVDAAGKTCVFVPAGSQFKAVDVSTQPGLPGTTEVDGLPSADASVLSNPATVFPDRGCS